jgi:hypothetical protein
VLDFDEVYRISLIEDFRVLKAFSFFLATFSVYDDLLLLEKSSDVWGGADGCIGEASGRYLKTYASNSFVMTDRFETVSSQIRFLTFFVLLYENLSMVYIKKFSLKNECYE